ncbi:hypothetical protein NC796_01705 [Aliifodinibius sp. S!AR15-10]|uniref:hypothetical protein n=1 Tax=Aliifodinibius sp. S!AR15-10 TaxID=2950437 RepID=UPI002856FE37|nr:hypothetical protein [Aliifodinibius sp. S!AR15-10]MDR8389833.1 hypothetical protein [Aliifodinibius sp. S!AR15-10]
MSDNQPIACDLTSIDNNEREQHKTNSEQLFTSIEKWQELPDGYRFRVPTETEMIEKAGSFMARERQCCPFFKFNLEVTPDGGPVWLKLRGNREVKQYIKQNVIPQLEENGQESWELPENTS